MSEQQQEDPAVLSGNGVVELGLDDMDLAETLAVTVANAVLQHFRPVVAQVYRQGFGAGFAAAQEQERQRLAAAVPPAPPVPGFRIVDRRRSTRIVPSALSQDMADNLTKAAEHRRAYASRAW